MIDYREIIRLKSVNCSNTSVASSTGNGQSKVSEAWKRVQEHSLSWPLPGTMTNEVLKQVLYPFLHFNFTINTKAFPDMKMPIWQDISMFLRLFCFLQVLFAPISSIFRQFGKMMCNDI